MSDLCRHDKLYLQRLFMLAFSTRAILLTLLVVTNATQEMHLSPDSERYHSVGVLIMREMERGFFNWPNWIDNGWFQFTGFVYFLLGPHQLAVQVLNITLGSLTVVVVFYLALEASRSSQVARISALLVALTPSFIFWSCMAIKDPVAILAMSLLVLCTIKLRQKFHMKWTLLMLLALLVFLGIREYMFFMSIGFIAMSMFLFTPYSLPRSGSWIGLATLAGAPMLFGFGVFGFEYFSNSMYFDIDYINIVRVDMGDHGAGALYGPDNVATWGESGLFEDFLAFLKGVMFFFVTLNFAEIGSVRQLMALPEVLLMVLLLPYLARGIHWLWLDRNNSFPILVFCFGVMLMLVSATTNIGALFRWRMQVMPLFVIAMCIGVFYIRRGWLYKVANKLAGQSAIQA